jgi:hypothetical protein
MSSTAQYSRLHYPELATKLEARVTVDPATGCWNWTRGVNADGYGNGVYVDGKQMRSHRVAFLVSTGSLPAPGLLIRHLCSNPRCCRPDHLAAGTPWENSQDTLAAGRHSNGAKSYRQKKASALAIRTAEGPYASIAERLGVSLSTVSRTRAGRTWSSLPGAEGPRKALGPRKLTEDDVRAIRSCDASNNELATRFGVTAPNIWAIRENRTWKHVV